MKKFTWEDFELSIDYLYEQIKQSGFKPEQIVAVQKGGTFPSLYLSYYFNYAKLNSIESRHYGPLTLPVKIITPDLSHLKNKNVLIVDDVIETGETIAAVVGAIIQFEPKTIKTACLIQKTKSKTNANYCGMITPDELSMPWYRAYKKAQTAASEEQI